MIDNGLRNKRATIPGWRLQLLCAAIEKLTGRDIANAMASLSSHMWTGETAAIADECRVSRKRDANPSLLNRSDSRHVVRTSTMQQFASCATFTDMV